MADWNTFLNHIAYDSVIIGFSGDKLKILLMEYHNTGLFALPGGFVQINENLDDAARRGLEERTGLTNIYLEQFHTFGNVSRHQPEVMHTILKASSGVDDPHHWLLGRFISVGYYALINYENVVPQPDALSDSCTWHSIDALPDLIFEHTTIVNKAIEALCANLDRKLVGMNLLPEKFTMKDLQQVYEAILGKHLHRTAFQREMLGSDLLIRHDKLYSGKAHKAPFLYSFRDKMQINVI